MPRKKVVKSEEGSVATATVAAPANPVESAPVLRNKKRPTSPKEPPKAEDLKALADEYDLSDLGKQYEVSEPADAEAAAETESKESQASQETPVQEPVKPVRHPLALLRMGREIGLTEADMATATTDQLADYIDATLRVKLSQQTPAKPVEPEVDPFESLEREYGPDLLAPMKALKAELKALKERDEAREKQFAEITKREQAREARSADEQIDAGFASLKNEKLFGTGPISKFKQGDVQGNRRIMVVKDLRDNPIPGVPLSEAVAIRAKELFGLEAAQETSPAAKAETNGHVKTAKNLEDLLKQRAAWKNGTLAEPNQPVEELPKGEKRAKQWLDKELKNRGLGQDAPAFSGGGDLDGLPD